MQNMQIEEAAQIEVACEEVAREEAVEEEAVEEGVVEEEEHHIRNLPKASTRPKTFYK